MEKYKISIVMPVYNLMRGGIDGYFEKLTQTILENPYKNIELILINDGSADDSLALCKNLEARDSRIKVIDQENKGASAARNRGLEAATGDYIHICDCDDELESNIYVDAMAVAEKYDPDVIRFNIRTQYGNGQSFDSIIEQPYDVLLDRRYIEDEVIPYMIGIKADEKKKMQGHCSQITKSSVIKANGVRYDENQKKEEDHPFMVSIMAYTQSMVFLKEPYYHYIKHRGSLVSRYSPIFRNICINFKLYEQLFGDIYDFKSQTRVRYNIRYLIESLDCVFLFRKDCDSREEVKAILNSSEAKQWFGALEPANRYEAKLKEYVIKGKIRRAYVCAFWHYVMMRAGNLKRKIARGIKI